MGHGFGRKTDRRQYNDPEHQLQVALVAWTALQPAREYRCLHSIPNGGKRHPAVAAKMKAEGQVAGVTDLFLAVARGGYHGLYLETKVDVKVPTLKGWKKYRTDLSAEQRAFRDRVRSQGYAHATYWTFEQGQTILQKYLAGEELGPDETPAGDSATDDRGPVSAIASYKARQHRRIR